MSGLFITFEGTEGAGKSTQITLLAERLRAMGKTVRTLREPGGTPIGEEIRHTLKHSDVNHNMTPETELLLMNASRAQLVREVIQPALAAGEVVLCDRFFDSTLVYQGFGRGLNMDIVRQIISCAIGGVLPNLTLLLMVPLAVSETRRLTRAQQPGSPVPQRDRIEDAGRDFFARVEQGYMKIAAVEPARIRVVDATSSVEAVRDAIWASVKILLQTR
jgi:dTMP kinase